MPILRSSPPSPFGRKVKIAAAELGLMDRLTIQMADTSDPSDSLRAQNPLGKIPALVFDDGATLFDSRVILEWLDVEAGGGRILPAAPEARFAALRLQALADGITDAAILIVYENRFRNEGERSAAWIEHQSGKIDRTLAHLEANPPADDAPLTVGTIALACALGYLDLRFAGRWRETHPRLVAWLDGFTARVPSVETTRFKG
ncbi:glutathione S-transferase family protein [Pinisolibacter aquiterrae]|uniref:glutathione S-transferase family protein n=1 Tax=Pinisolibacter aquiterrae TaxID=2815579 RepID=UPI001C3E330A|nr:glutathione S-transferase family protein [Pinisolibacter aquiterrae]MBV5263341.1 glutathione S-transferase family protein [Pinisolibacter aquiterrae]MCC8237581.1 glutathione S-transferase family protein [Pinisolibacter aquiterrae]